jgi:ribosomal RNA-processing protein 12
MKILSTVFTVFKHRDTFVIVEKCLSSLANLRESEQFDYKKEADFAIGRAIQTYGPKLVIDCIPLHITGDELVSNEKIENLFFYYFIFYYFIFIWYSRTTYDYPRSWMLPLLKENIEKTELSYFVEKLLPLSRKLKAKSIFLLQNKQLIESKILDNLQNQVIKFKIQT